MNIDFFSERRVGFIPMVRAVQFTCPVWIRRARGEARAWEFDFFYLLVAQVADTEQNVFLAVHARISLKLILVRSIW